MIVEGRYIEDGNAPIGRYSSPINGDDTTFDEAFQEADVKENGELFANMELYEGNESYSLYRNNGKGESVHRSFIVKLARSEESELRGIVQ